MGGDRPPPHPQPLVCPAAVRRRDQAGRPGRHRAIDLDRGQRRPRCQDQVGGPPPPGTGLASPDPHDVREAAQRAGQDDIWARYQAKCDAVFAADSTADELDRWSTEHIRHNERVLNRLRNERDRALAALSRRLGPQPPRQAPASPHSPATRQTQLAVAERDALRKLDDSGFIGSQVMADAILDLAMPLAGIIERSISAALRKRPCATKSAPLRSTTFVLTPNTQTKTIRMILPISGRGRPWKSWPAGG